jgi:hypothetical protein
MSYLRRLNRRRLARFHGRNALLLLIFALWGAGLLWVVMEPFRDFARWMDW